MLIAGVLAALIIACGSDSGQDAPAAGSDGNGTGGPVNADTDGSTTSPTVPAPLELTSEDAVVIALQLCVGIMPEMGPVANPHNPVTELMTLAEFEGILGSSSSRDLSRPVWVVQFEGESYPTGTFAGEPGKPPLRYEYAGCAIDGQSSEMLSAFRLFSDPYLPPLPDVSTSEPDPEPEVTPRPSVVEDSANMAGYDSVATVLVGTVVERIGEEWESSSAGHLSSLWGFWRIEVEQYLVSPLEQDEIVLGLREPAVLPDGQLSVPRFPISLEPGQQAIFFLRESSERDLSAVENYMELILSPPWMTSFHTIEDGQVETFRNKQSGLEPVGDFVLRIIEVAQAAGKEAGLVLIDPDPTPTPGPFPDALLSGVHTVEQMQRQIDTWPEDYKIIVNEDVAILFAYPSPHLDWAGPVSIKYIPCVCSLVINHEGDVIFDGVKGAEAKAAISAVLADEDLMAQIAQSGR